MIVVEAYSQLKDRSNPAGCLDVASIWTEYLRQDLEKSTLPTPVLAYHAKRFSFGHDEAYTFERPELLVAESLAAKHLEGADYVLEDCGSPLVRDLELLPEIVYSDYFHL